MEEPVVSICCICYNQEKYIIKALKGFFMQITHFPFEIVISDDCSEDGTRKIINKYKSKYPGVIRDVSPDNNIGVLSNWWHVQSQAKGKYVAICEGDDYWIDPYKLQKQVDYLEKHQDYSMCFHAANIYNEVGVDLTNPKFMNVLNKDYSSDEIKSSWIVATASVVYRRIPVLCYKINHIEWLIYGDIALFLTCAEVGKVRGMADRMSVYRINSGGVTMQAKNDLAWYRRASYHDKCLRVNFPKLSRSITGDVLAKYHYTLARCTGGLLDKIVDFTKAFYYSPKYVLSKIFLR